MICSTISLTDNAKLVISAISTFLTRRGNEKSSAIMKTKTFNKQHYSCISMVTNRWGITRSRLLTSSHLRVGSWPIFPIKNSTIKSFGVVAKSTVFKSRQFWSLLSSHLRFKCLSVFQSSVFKKGLMKVMSCRLSLELSSLFFTALQWGLSPHAILPSRELNSLQEAVRHLIIYEYLLRHLVSLWKSAYYGGIESPRSKL